MTSAADRFGRLEKLAIFLIALGEERTREILADVDTDTLQHLNGAMAGLGDVSAEEKAAVMLEFAHFFYADEPIGPGPGGVPDLPTAPAPPKAGKPPGGKRARPRRSQNEMDLSGEKPVLSDEEQAILHTLDKLRREVDPGQIDWGRAGYDFGDGFKGTDEGRR
ncbi:MAG: hypothetical protein QF689_08865 [Candidatus Latescibacteria bacterium]|jgi:hypothetical protein|nr:hypothetical protein [Candidatus Latescibacterota bacterium]MDP7448682.1 hypothetical protein [Candidatus Latescibacterota bacterium]HJP31162.1 hypothetical protein [Candidatus Latescibacterota bacterium]